MEKKTSLVGSFESYMCKKTRSNNINCWTFKYCSFIRMKDFLIRISQAIIRLVHTQFFLEN